MTTDTKAVTVRDDPPHPSAVDPQVAEAMRIREQIETVKSVIAPNLNDQELQLFSMVAQRLRLDPFVRQIHAIKRQGKVTFQTGIDGFRASAEETGEYRGSELPVFGDIVPTPFPHPEWAEVVVHRQNADGTVTDQAARVYWDEFFPGTGNEGFMWRKMPRNQLAKCAEAAAFRRAFPKRFAGIYAPEEMEQDRATIDVTPAPGTSARDRAAAKRAEIEAGTTRAVGPLGGADGDGDAAAGGGPPPAGSAPDQTPEAAPAADPAGPSAASGLTAEGFRAWLREKRIAIPFALAEARKRWGDDVLIDDLTGEQRGELQAALEQ